ncbi:MAG: hypothetical protein EA347_08500 [Thioalkalivibrio sp.]|nr:MAG: hypothetical protein EA347_08500 [Thioalkalivibrio sp.]
MSDMASRLESIRDQLAEVATQLAGSAQTEAAGRLQSLAGEMERVIADLQEPSSPQPSRKVRRKLPDVEKCPRCTIRSLHIVPEEVRTGADGADEVLWHCASCGHEVWRKDS